MKDNFIEIYKNALSNKSCDYIMDCFNEFKEHVYVGKTGSGVQKEKKDSLDLNLLKFQNKLQDFLLKEIKASLKTHISKYMEKYKLTGGDKEKLWKLFSIFPWSIHAKKYIKNTGGYHMFHSDDNASGASIYRQLVCMYYLNTVSEGGETEFYHQDLKIKPQKGALVVFPAFFTHLHKGNTPLSNDKYILNFWLMRGNENPQKVKYQNGFTLN
tara:strand:+ start:446 stop:1084 length:639 start_codon:yes stop_codon:yes gene_type:complete